MLSRRISIPCLWDSQRLNEKLSLHFRKSDEPPWSAKAVDRILHNEVYTGKLVQGKTRRLDYRSKKKMNVPMRDWTIVDNTHEAIISAEQFELVQRILETETRRPNDAETVALFAGFLYCGDCGSRLVRRSASYKGKRYIYYQCSGSKQNKGSCTSLGYQSSTVLDEPEREAGTTSIPIPQREESENIPLPDLPGQLENVQQSGNEIAKRGMPT